MTLSEFIENYNIDISMYEFFTLDKLINMSATNSKIALEVSAYMLARAKNQIATHARLSPVECIKWAGAAMTISDVLYKKYQKGESTIKPLSLILNEEELKEVEKLINQIKK